MPIVLESNQNHAVAENTEVCTCLPASMGMGGGYVPMVVEPVVFRPEQTIKVDCNGTTFTLESREHKAPQCVVCQAVDVLPFDTTQVTSDKNWSHPKYGDPCHPLANGQHPPSVVIKEKAEKNR